MKARFEYDETFAPKDHLFTSPRPLSTALTLYSRFILNQCNNESCYIEIFCFSDGGFRYPALVRLKYDSVSKLRLFFYVELCLSELMLHQACRREGVICVYLYAPLLSIKYNIH